LNLYPRTYATILEGSPLIGDVHNTQNILMNLSGSLMDGLITVLMALLLLVLHGLVCFKVFRR